MGVTAAEVDWPPVSDPDKDTRVDALTEGVVEEDREATVLDAVKEALEEEENDCVEVAVVERVGRAGSC